MLEHKVSPLLDAMEIGECFSQHDGASCYEIRHPESGREFVLKVISVPASAEQVSALLLTGAYASEEEADAYYRKEAEDLVREAASIIVCNTFSVFLEFFKGELFAKFKFKFLFICS